MNVLATLDANGAALALVPGQAFTTYRQLVEDEADALALGVPIGQYAPVEINHSAAALEAYGPEDRARYDIQIVTANSPPDGKAEASRTLLVDDHGAITCEQSFVDAAPLPVPTQVERVQGRIALLDAGKLSDAEAAVAAAEAHVQEYWSSTSIFRRDNAMLITLWHGLGGTDDQLDDLFRAAAAVPI